MIWEEWTYRGTGQDLRHQATKAMVINEQGGVVMPERPIQVRLNPCGAANVITINDRAVWLTGYSSTGRLTLQILDPSLQLNSVPLE